MTLTIPILFTCRQTMDANTTSQYPFETIDLIPFIKISFVIIAILGIIGKLVYIIQLY